MGGSRNGDTPHRAEMRTLRAGDEMVDREGTVGLLPRDSAIPTSPRRAEYPTLLASEGAPAPHQQHVGGQRAGVTPCEKPAKRTQFGDLMVDCERSRCHAQR